MILQSGNGAGAQTKKEGSLIYNERTQSKCDLVEIPEMVTGRSTKIKKSVSAGSLAGQSWKSRGEVEKWQIQKMKMMEQLKFYDCEKLGSQSQIQEEHLHSVDGGARVGAMHVTSQPELRRASSLPQAYQGPLSVDWLSKSSCVETNKVNAVEKIARSSVSSRQSFRSRSVSKTGAKAEKTMVREAERRLKRDPNHMLTLGPTIITGKVSRAKSEVARDVTCGVASKSPPVLASRFTSAAVVERKWPHRSTSFNTFNPAVRNEPSSKPKVIDSIHVEPIVRHENRLDCNLSTSSCFNSRLFSKSSNTISSCTLSADESEHKQFKRSSSKLGFFFKRIFPSLRGNKTSATRITNETGDFSANSSCRVSTSPYFTKKSEMRCNSSDSALSRVSETTDMISFVFDMNKIEKTNNSSSSSSQDDGKLRTKLFDIDLVFDKLLLKSYHDKDSAPSSITRSFGKQAFDRASTATADTTAEEEEIDIKRASMTYEIDYDLINDFSKLGDYIHTSCENEDHSYALGSAVEKVSEKIGSVSSLTPPPRSNKRPVGSRSYRRSQQDLSLKSSSNPNIATNHQTDRLLNNLKQRWKIVHINESMPRVSSSSSNSTQGSYHSTSEMRESPVSINRSSKRLEFSDDIYVNNTYSHLEFRRCDRDFLKERNQLVTSVDGLPFVQSVKCELNTYKKDEMTIHPESAQNIQFFI